MVIVKKKPLPKLKNDLDSLQNIDYDIKVFSIATEFDKNEWKKFITNHKDWKLDKC